MNPSLVVRLGHTEKKVESRSVADHGLPAAEFLRVPHQGARLHQPSRSSRLSRLESPWSRSAKRIRSDIPLKRSWIAASGWRRPLAHGPRRRDCDEEG